MRFLSLFSGIEAASCAWLPLGWECAAVSEIEPFPCAVLKHHYPEAPNLGDVTKITREQVEALGHIDLLVGGFPCQDLSVAGKRAGLRNDDGSATRSGLFFTGMQIADWSKAQRVLVENVPGIFSSNKGRDFAAVVGEMAGCGFDVPRDGWENAGVAVGPRGIVEWATLDAQYFGVPQRRRRVFIIRDSGDWSRRPPFFLERHSLSGNPAPRRETGKSIAGTISKCSFDGGAGGRPEGAAGNHFIPSIVGQAMSAKWAKGTAGPAGDEHHNLLAVPQITHSLRGAGFDASEDGTGRGVPLVPTIVFQIEGENYGWLDGGTPQGENDLPHRTVRSVLDDGCGSASQERGLAGPLSDEPSTPLPQLPHEGAQERQKVSPVRSATQGARLLRQALSAFEEMGRPGIGKDQSIDAAATGGPNEPFEAVHRRGLQASNAREGVMQQTCAAIQTGNARTGAAHKERGGNAPMAVRRLTPEECEALQGFPRLYTQVPTRNKPAADGPRYKALGNSMAVPCMAWIGQRIQQVAAL